jgi:hypothetical protein
MHTEIWILKVMLVLELLLLLVNLRSRLLHLL